MSRLRFVDSSFEEPDLVRSAFSRFLKTVVEAAQAVEEDAGAGGGSAGGRGK